MRVLRDDPCSYCDGPGGTVDHVVAQSSGLPDRNRWHNFTGACQGCNGSKGNMPLLLFLARRGVIRRRRRAGR